MTGSEAVTVLEFRTELRAPLERVFEALTEPDRLAHWFCHAATGEAAPGGRLNLSWSGPEASRLPFVGRWLVFEPPVGCAYEGGHAGYPDGYAGRVGFELAPGGPGTVLVTRHRLPARPDYAPVIAVYREAWPRALERLASLLRAGGDAPASPASR